jgi:hypothetical protein
VFEGLPFIRASPIKYLGLPLLIWQLKRVDLQPLEGKMAGKLATWDGKNINAADRGALVKSILTSRNFPSNTSKDPTVMPCLHE